MDVVVVGLGAMGSATLYQLARRGLRVVGIDRYRPPHDCGSSHGETRITRQAIGEGEAYVPLALRSHAIWRELEAETGQELFRACGFLAIDGADGAALFHGKPGFFDTTVAAAKRFDIAHECLNPDDAGARFPQFRFAGHERIYFEPGGGLVFPERCIAAQLAQAQALGAAVRTDTEVIAIEADGDGVVVRTAHDRFRAARAIVTAGGWSPALLASPMLKRMRLLRQVLHWFEVDPAKAWNPPNAPTFIWTHGLRPEDSFYGFPPVEGLTPGVKVATEQYAEELDRPEEMDREVTPSEADKMFSVHLSGRLTNVTAKVLRSAACFYTHAPTGEFLVDYTDDRRRVLAVSACSGHGFKHSAALGEDVASAVVDASPLPAAFRHVPVSSPA